MVHPGRHERAPLEIVTVLREVCTSCRALFALCFCILPNPLITFLSCYLAPSKAGADLGRVIIAHVDRTLFALESLDALAATGVFIELDLFGVEIRCM